MAVQSKNESKKTFSKSIYELKTFLFEINKNYDADSIENKDECETKSTVLYHGQILPLTFNFHHHTFYYTNYININELSHFDPKWKPKPKPKPATKQKTKPTTETQSQSESKSNSTSNSTTVTTATSIDSENETKTKIDSNLSQKNEFKTMQLLYSFHKNLEKERKTIYDRYGWYPNIYDRIKFDCSSELIGFIINNDKNNIDGANGEVMGMIVLIGCEKTAKLTLNTNVDNINSNLKVQKEIAIIVLNKYQRHRLATDLVRVTWELFAQDDNDNNDNNNNNNNDDDEESTRNVNQIVKQEWIYVLNSIKSGAFWRTFKQWYPHVMFKIVRP